MLELATHFGMEHGLLLPQLLNDHFGFYNCLLVELGGSLFLLDLLLNLLYLLLLLVEGFRQALDLPVAVLNVLLLVHDVYLELPSVYLQGVNRVSQLVDFGFNLAALVLVRLPLFRKPLYFVVLQLLLLLEGVADFALPVQLLPDILNLAEHALDFDVQVLSTLSVVVRRVFYLDLGFFQLSLLLPKLLVVVLKRVDELHVLFQGSLQGLDVGGGLLVEVLGLLDVGLVLLLHGFHLLLSHLEVLPHLLLSV